MTHGDAVPSTCSQANLSLKKMERESTYQTILYILPRAIDKCRDNPPPMCRLALETCSGKPPRDIFYYKSNETHASTVDSMGIRAGKRSTRKAPGAAPWARLSMASSAILM